MKEISVLEQRYQAVLAVIRDGVPIVEVARCFDVSGLAVVARDGSDWVSRVVAAHGMISVSNQPESMEKHRAGRRVDVHVQESALQIWDGDELIKIDSWVRWKTVMQGRIPVRIGLDSENHLGN